MAPAEVMNGTRDEFLASPGFAQDQNRGVGRSDRFNVLEDSFEGGALADNFLKIVFRADFIFEIELLRVQLILEFSDLLVRQRILHRNGELTGDLIQQINLLGGKGSLSKTTYIQRPQDFAV